MAEPHTAEQADMIKYTLRCDQGHSFESWFQSGDAYDTLAQAGHVACVSCGSKTVSKTLMAPRVRPARNAAQDPAHDPALDPVRAPDAKPVETNAQPMALSAPQSQAEAALSALRKQVEENSDYVGSNFAKQARDMHLGDVPNRSIYGTAGPEEAKALIEDGIPVMPLPFIPKESAN